MLSLQKDDFKQKLEKTFNCKTRHGTDDEEYKRIKIKIYSCKYCKILFARSINCLYHELHCQPREAGDIGSGTDTKCSVKPIIILMGMQKNVGQTSQLGTKS